MKNAFRVTLLAGCLFLNVPISYGGPPASNAAPPSVFGVFQGRTPCQEIAAELGISVREECTKRKIHLTLFQDPLTARPTTFQSKGLGDAFREGKWTIV